MRNIKRGLIQRYIILYFLLNILVSIFTGIFYQTTILSEILYYFMIVVSILFFVYFGFYFKKYIKMEPYLYAFLVIFATKILGFVTIVFIDSYTEPWVYFSNLYYSINHKSIESISQTAFYGQISMSFILDLVILTIFYLAFVYMGTKIHEYTKTRN